MMNHETNDLKILKGQPWSSWKSIFMNPLADMESDALNHIISTSEPACSVKLQKSDMAIYGLCPKTELFELAVCNHCGDKFKMPALAEHIKLRHAGDATSLTNIKCDKLEKSLHKKGKVKKAKEKSERTEKKHSNENTSVDINANFTEVVSEKHSVSLDPEIVTKLKEINLKNIVDSNGSKISKQDSRLLEKDNSCATLLKLNKELSCSSSVEPADLITSHVKLKNSFPQDGDVVHMQLIVQLSPLSTRPLTNSNNQLPVSNEDKKLLDNQCTNSNKLINDIGERTLNPDITCNVDKENTKPSAQNLNYSNSISKQKLIQCKQVKLLSNDNTIETSELSSGNLSGENNSNCGAFSTKSSTIKFQTSTPPSIFNTQIEKTESVNGTSTNGHKKVSKRITNDKPRLSLPVSIKNPSILCQLQNKVMKSKYSLSLETACNGNVKDITKRNFGSKILRNVQTRRASKENSVSPQLYLKNDDVSSPDSLKEETVELEMVEKWHPGFRRLGGLLFANHNYKTTANETTSTLSPEGNCMPLIEPILNNFNDKNDIIDLCSSDLNDIDLSKLHFEIDCEITNNVSLPSLQTGHLVLTNNSKAFNKERLFESQYINNNQSIICKRTKNINGAISLPPTKILKQEDTSHFVGNTYSGNDSNSSLMESDESSHAFENQLPSPVQHFSPNSLADSVNSNCNIPVSSYTGVLSHFMQTDQQYSSTGSSTQVDINVTRANSLRLRPPRIHSITESGLLPVTTFEQPNVKKSKPMRLQLMSQLDNSAESPLCPQNTINCSNINGFEER